jgi:hypothetical protein
MNKTYGYHENNKNNQTFSSKQYRLEMKPTRNRKGKQKQK